MSVVIDGMDFAQYYGYTSLVMSNRLDSILQGKNEGIPVGVLEEAKGLFKSVTNFLTKEKEKITGNFPSRYAVYLMVRDMLTKVYEIEENRIDPELEKLASAVQELTREGGPDNYSREDYEKLRDVFRGIHSAQNPYGHSKYSIGTFSQ